MRLKPPDVEVLHDDGDGDDDDVEVRRLATGLRRAAREERVLFHYNGHGVPKPTANGEIWVFNRLFLMKNVILMW